MLVLFAKAGELSAFTMQLPEEADSIYDPSSHFVRDLDELVVTRGKRHYSKKNNPAVVLMNEVRRDKDKVWAENADYFSCDVYEKTLLGINDFNGEFSNDDSPLRKFSLLEECIDTARWTGKKILALSLREKVYTQLNSLSPKCRKELIGGMRNAGIDEAFNQSNISAVLEDVLRKINIYDNDITLMQNRFVSPLSHIAADYYMFHLGDTVMVGTDRCVELDFAPHTPETFGFNGTLYIASTPDSIYYVRKVYMRVPASINLNYVKNIFVSQHYRLLPGDKCVKTVDDLSLDLRIIAGTPSFYGRRLSMFSNFKFDKRYDLEEFYTRAENEIVLEGVKDDDGFWSQHRVLPLSRSEAALEGMMTGLRKIPLIYWSEKVLKLLEQGYVVTGRKSKFDFGPLNTLISYNSAEGVRLRIGGMTTANLSDRLFARGYVAYGFKDRKPKYSAELEYSFNDKKYHSREFPVNSILARYTYDLDMLGQHYLHTNADNVFLSLKRKSSYLVTYRRLAELRYKLELANNFSMEFGIEHTTQYATPWVGFIDGYGVSHSSFRQAAAYMLLRYAPGEKFVQGRNNRAPINMDAPVFVLRHEYGPKRLLGSSFTLNRTELSVSKRFWFSAFGYTDLMVKGGKIWSQVQFPALLWPNANLSYTIQPESYSLMNPMEFAIDQYLSADMTYWMNGLILNRIPLVKKLKFREILTFKALWGGLTKRNNPAYCENLYRFPYDSDTHTLGRTPYMEIGVGLDNILTILRIDYVWRLTYRNLPGTDRSGLRVSLHFSF